MIIGVSKVSLHDAAVLVLSAYISDDLTGTCKAPSYIGMTKPSPTTLKTLSLNKLSGAPVAQ